jgi:hypothetical protein
MATIILNTLVDIYEPQVHPDIPPKLIKRNVKCRKSFDSHVIQTEEYIKPNGEISSKWCNIKEGESYYRVAHSFDYVHKLISPLYITGYKRFDSNNKLKKK